MKERKAELDVLGTVPLELVAVLGSKRLRLRELLELGEGSVLLLDRAANEPIEVLAGGTLVARGEIVAVDEHFGVRITELAGART